MICDNFISELVKKFCGTIQHSNDCSIRDIVELVINLTFKQQKTVGSLGDIINS